jgi:4a-hydroxytetrahydrobiopterin dehydratase
MNEWTEFNNRLMRTYSFADFTEAINWLLKISSAIKIHEHYPVFTNVNRTIYVTLSTATEAGLEISDKDRHLAEILDALYIAP